MTSAGVVVVTMGDREATLETALASVRAQYGDPIEIVVVGNGCNPSVHGVRVVALPANVGVSRGRNAGWVVSSADVIFFLDDDARYASPGVVAATLARFDASPRLAIVSFRIVDEGGRVVRKHLPMLRKSRSDRVVRVTTFLGGACAIRREVLATVGGFPDEFFYGLEETDLAWRVLDRGLDVLYAGDLEVTHPHVPMTERSGAIYHTARNRILLARRRLPILLAMLYVPIRFALSLTNLRSWADVRALFSGYRAGFLDPITVRQPIRWATAWRMSRLGRPPVV